MARRTRVMVERMAAASWFRKVAPVFLPRLDRVLHKLSGGKILLSQQMLPSLMLVTTGARSGLERKTPLACLPEADGGFLIVGSNYGRDAHPAWTANLRKNPEAAVTYRGKRTTVTAHLLDADEKAEAWPRLLKLWPPYARYTEISGRDLRIFRLTPRP